MNFMTRFERWDPFDELSLMRSRMDRLLNKMTPATPDMEEIPANIARWAPITDILETKDALLFRAELPGINEKDVTVELENGVLTISGERKIEEETKDKNYHRLERAYGKFTRSFTLPPNVETEKIKATFTDGLLELNIPKKEEAKPKKITLDIHKKLATAA